MLFHAYLFLHQFHFLKSIYTLIWVSLMAPQVKNPPEVQDTGGSDSIPETGRSAGGGKRWPTPVFFPGESHGQRSLAGLSLWSHKGSMQLSNWRMPSHFSMFYDTVFVGLYSFTALLCFWSIYAHQLYFSVIFELTVISVRTWISTVLGVSGCLGGGCSQPSSPVPCGRSSQSLDVLPFAFFPHL